MNLLENYIVEIHSVKDYNPEDHWFFGDIIERYIEVDMTTDCYGSIRRDTCIFTEREFEEIKRQGYFMA